MKRTALITTALLLLAAGTTAASGVMIPVKHGLPPLAIKYQRVSVEIDNQVARTTVAQSFLNGTNRQLEATYVFPLPKDASVSDFTMLVNGKEIKGELLDATQARKIYQDIVNRMKDPGLLEYLGNNLFKASVFPIPPNGEQKIELKYSQIVERDAGICRYTYPLKVDDKSSRTLEDFSVGVTIRSKEAIKTVYSPTHKIGVTKKDDHTAVVGFEQGQAQLDKDFVLYYALSDKDFGLNLLAHRQKGEDGYFMVLISPRTEIKPEAILAKDICFVIDSSGSMQGPKIKQAKDALKYCVENLHARDRFNIIRFSTAVDPFEDKLIDASKENIERAVKFIGGIGAVGGTNIDGALQEALAPKSDPKRPYLVIFLTDGLPTQGNTTDPKQIVQNCKAKTAGNTRIFCFGVGNDVNTHLLDSLSGMSRGLTTYVRPGEDIEMKVSTFHDKANYPVMAELSLHSGKVKLRDMYPQTPPDLFKGSQLIVLGRYREDGNVAVSLKGTINGKEKEFVYEASFPGTTDDNGFIPRLWATRKVGYLLDQIRLHGEKPELRQEVVSLAKKFGIVTPYTSYLIVPDRPIAMRPRLGPALRPAITRAEAAALSGSMMRDGDRSITREHFNRARGMGGKAPSKPADAAELSPSVVADAHRRMSKQSGKESVDFAQTLSELKSARTEGGRKLASGMRLIGAKTFYLVEGVWTDETVDDKAEKIEIKFGSDAYLAIIEAAPAEYKPWLMLGEKVMVMLPGGKCLVVGDEGSEKLAKDEAARLFEK